MSTRLKRPAFWRHVAVALGLVAFQGYLGFSYFSGQFGIESQDMLEAQIDELNASSNALQAEIDSYVHRIALFQTTRLDPDLVSERARALLSMSEPDDIVVLVDPVTGKPLSSSPYALTEVKLSSIIAAETD
ncbi:FtsB family cell division protein [Devosia sp.]|uniref:FtsB family cell division protein n=1 Tax=Devosia sp. TaxID=1871048 RepID=UPI003A90DED8